MVLTEDQKEFLKKIESKYFFGVNTDMVQNFNTELDKLSVDEKKLITDYLYQPKYMGLIKDINQLWGKLSGSLSPDGSNNKAYKSCLEELKNVLQFNLELKEPIIWDTEIKDKQALLKRINNLPPPLVEENENENLVKPVDFVYLKENEPLTDTETETAPLTDTETETETPPLTDTETETETPPLTVTETETETAPLTETGGKAKKQKSKKAKKQKSKKAKKQKSKKAKKAKKRQTKNTK